MKTRIATSLIAALIAAAMPFGYAFIKLGGFEYGEFMAYQFFLSCVMFFMAFVMTFTCPLWSSK